MRQPSRLGSGAQQIEDDLDDATERVNLPPPCRMVARKERLQKRPFLIPDP